MKILDIYYDLRKHFDMKSYICEVMHGNVVLAYDLYLLISSIFFCVLILFES